MASKRRRVVLSCVLCRSRKLKCDRQRPTCNNCLKHGSTCEYLVSANTDDRESIESQIKSLKSQIDSLESKRNQSTPSRSSTVVDFSQVFCLSSLIKNNKYVGCMLESTEIGRSLPLFIGEAFEKEKDKVSNLDLLKFKIKQQGNGLYDAIKPYFADVPKVRLYMKTFFETELFSNFAYMNKAQFYDMFDSFFSSNREELSTPDYYFMGQLLLIMRIVYISLYNCGYEDVDESMFVGVEAFNLASICFDEAKFPSQFQNLESLRLHLLMFESELYSPESTGMGLGLIQASAQNVLQNGIFLRYNIDPVESTDANYIRMTWHHMLDLERTDLVYNGTSIFTDFDSYTTKLPTLNRTNVDEFTYIIAKRYHDRHTDFRDLLFELSDKITNAKNPPSLEDYEKILDRVIKKCNGNSLELIMKLESNTKKQRSIKAFKFVDFLDFHCLAFMLANRIFLVYDEREDSTKKRRSIENLLKLSNSMITLTYFIDPHQQHYFNLKEHFGHSIQLIPKILQNLHRVIELQYTLLARACYQCSFYPSFKLHEIKRITFQNTKVIISSFGVISNRYLQAKRLFMVHSYLVLKVFGLRCELSDAYLAVMKYFGMMETDENQKLSQETSEVILKNLIELSGERDLSQSLYEETLTHYFEDLTSDLNIKSSDPFPTERMSQFSDTQSFLL